MLHRKSIVTHALAVVWILSGWVAVASASTVTSLDLLQGSVEFDGRFHRVLDRLLDQEGSLIMGAYQPAPDILPPLIKRHRTFSLFTSGVQGAHPPSAIINGSQITVDLSSLFFGISHGDKLKAWNIGGPAGGMFDSETLAFSITWEHLFRDRPHPASGTFTLQGTAVVAATPLPASLVFFATGLAVLVWSRRRRWGGPLESPVVGAR